MTVTTYFAPIVFISLSVGLLCYHVPINPMVWIAYLSFLAFLWFVSLLMPGRIEYGVPLSDGTRIPYKTNGLSVFIVSSALFNLGPFFKLWNQTIIYDNFMDFVAVVNCVALIIGALLYFTGVFKSKEKTGNVLLDFWFGVELNPRLLGLDFKFFSEGRPQLIGWALVVQSLCWHQINSHGFIGIPMMLYAAMIHIYIFDYFFHEINITSTYDIIAEKYGYMLVWGNYFFVPFYYSLQAWYLIVPSHVSIPPMLIMFDVLLFIIGFSVFRGSNNQKHSFKTQGARAVIWGESPLVVESADGKKRLLASGWWGLSRHPNYFGDLLLAFSFSIPTLVQASLPLTLGLENWNLIVVEFVKTVIVPFSYPIFLSILLIHRSGRDEERMKEKYGDVFNRYAKYVPHRIIPFVF